VALASIATVAVTQTPTRRRRSPEEAEGEILDAARELLSVRPWSEVTVGEVMERTTLSRKSFYVYFRDRHDLITRLVAPLRARGDEAMNPGLRREALFDVARMYQEHGVLLRALQEASHHDAEAARAWHDFTEGPIGRLADWIRAEIDAGRIEGIDPDGTARALVGMNLYAFFDRLVGNSDADIEALVEQLDAVWERTLWLGPRPR
jgi:TetR/AcrR family transcriptional regulator, ethionamide resistance regulator